MDADARVAVTDRSMPLVPEAPSPAARDAAGPPLGPSERATLQAAAALVIPASAEWDVPGADDPLILADIEATLGRDRDAVLAALAHLDAAAGGPLAEQPAPRRAAAAAWLREHQRALADTLAQQVAACYYRDERVMRSIGLPPRPPYPDGYAVPAGDLSLLDPVRARGRLWREA
jgi:hypothetical protein